MMTNPTQATTQSPTPASVFTASLLTTNAHKNQVFFINTFTKFLRIGIFANKGTDDDNSIEYCASFYLKLEQIKKDFQLYENHIDIINSTKSNTRRKKKTNKKKNIPTKQDIEHHHEFIRKLYKRFNLLFKCTTLPNTTTPIPVDIQDKSNQINIAKLPSVFNPNHITNASDLIMYATVNNMHLFKGATTATSVPLSFIIDHEYKDLMFGYIEFLFTYTQFLITNDEAFEDNCMSQLGCISNLERSANIENLMLNDSYLKLKLNYDRNQVKFLSACDETKRILKQNGIVNPKIIGMVDTVIDDLKNVQDLDANITSTVVDVATNIINENMHDVGKDTFDAESIRTSINIVTDIADKETDVPQEIKGIISTIHDNMDDVMKGNSDDPAKQAQMESKIKSVVETFGGSDLIGKLQRACNNIGNEDEEDDDASDDEAVGMKTADNETA
ncbi:Hypothetical protein MVR_LOCUS246 [uncultured virus]|nr:Hypothetical protein MVR_LOCUS246 [uncultured virus]